MPLFRRLNSGRAADDRPPLSLAEARWKRGEAVLADLDGLNAKVPDTRFEKSFTHAKAAFLREEFAVAAALLQEIRQAYAAANARGLGEEPKAARLSRKEARLRASRQAAVREVLGDFDGLIGALNSMASRPSGRHAPRAADAAGLPDGFAAEFQAAESLARKNEVIRRHFAAGPVNTTGDVKLGALYALRGEDSVSLLLTADHFPAASLIPLSDALSGGQLRPLSMEDFLKLGKSRQLVGLQPRHRRRISAGTPGSAAEETGPSNDYVPLDLAAFNQLVLAADQCGLIAAIPVSNARDQFFRRGRYHNAFRAIERLYQEFAAKAQQRAAQLKQEEVAYQRGRLEMSPRQWMEKQRRDAAQTQRVERARKHFKLVLDGLRILDLRQQQTKG